MLSELPKIPKGKSYKSIRDQIRKKALTKETHEALVVSTKSLIACVKYLLNNEFFFVLTLRLSSDKIEEMFGTIRQMGGGNLKCDAASVDQAFDKIVCTGIAIVSKNSIRLEKN